MSLKKNIIANYCSQFYVTVIGIIMVPTYIRYMGTEAYGLIGFYAMLQAWFILLDIGLSSTVARESARYDGGAADADSYFRLVRTLQVIFLLISVASGSSLFLAAGYLAKEWLQASELPVVEIQNSIQLMAPIVALRWMCGLYRGIISGFERLVWLSGYNAAIATLRFAGVVLVLMYVGVTPTVFFSFQLSVALLEIIGLIFFSWRLIPINQKSDRSLLSWIPRPQIKFSLTIAFTSLISVLVTQTDKLILSKVLSLVEYGYYTIAIVVAGGVTFINGPVGAAIMPRMSKLEASGDHVGLVRIYRNATQLVSIFAAAASVTLAFYGESLLWVWTGNQILANQAAEVLVLYGIGNGILAVSAFPYYLQYAKGDLSLHLKGATVFAIFFVPVIFWAANAYGAVGAGYAWVAMNIILFFTWLPFIHQKFAPGLNRKWYVEDVISIYLITIVSGHFLEKIWPRQATGAMLVLTSICFGFVLLIFGAIGSSKIRDVVWKMTLKGSERIRGMEK